MKKALFWILLLSGCQACGGQYDAESQVDAVEAPLSDCERVAAFFEVIDAEKCSGPWLPSPDANDPGTCWAVAFSQDHCYSTPDCAAEQMRTLANTCQGAPPVWELP